VAAAAVHVQALEPVHDLTIDVEFGGRIINKSIKLQIWDTVCPAPLFRSSFLPSS
jgi:hypothetical protein